MKKKRWNPNCDSGWKKIFFTMRITLFFLFAGLLQVSASVYSQQTKLQLKVEKTSVSEVLKMIEGQSDFHFLYRSDNLKGVPEVTIDVQDAKLEDVLNQIIVPYGFTYEIDDRTVVIKRAAPIVVTNPTEQKKKISGSVKDSKGLPLPGVSVVVKGTTTGIITDADGKFTLSVPADAKTLSFSFVGMKSQEIILGNRTSINVAMVEEIAEIEEVVAVGYGTQKKVNLTGSVSSVSSNTLLERPAAPNATNLLEGRITGLQVIQPSGQPGKDDGILQIRGLGSFGASSAPLVLIDGIIGSLSDIAPNDIENISVLKDAASASIYGSRAANGVILVTTKQGKKGTNIEYKLDVGVHTATHLPKGITNSAEYMKMSNIAFSRSGLDQLYTQTQIDAYANAKNDPQYPNFNWVDYYFKSTAVTNHYLSISNVTDKSSFRFSLNYLNQPGIINTSNTSSKRYNVLINYSSQLTKSIKIGTNVRAVFRDNVEPPWIYGDFSTRYIFGNNPLYMPYLPDGSGRKTAWAYPNEMHNVTEPIIFSNGANYSKNYSVNAKAFMEVDLFKGLTWQIDAGINYSNNFSKFHSFATQDHYMYQKLPGEADYRLNPAVSSPSGAPALLDMYGISTIPTVYSTLNYYTQIANSHNITAMLGYEQQSMLSRNISGSKTQFPTIDLMELNAGADVGQQVSGSSEEWALRSYFGRLGYNFKGKYLFEANVRYDGTSRVAAANRWGFFPSASVGWRMSEESFIKNNLKWVDNLKLRGSYGVLGNQEIGNYPFQDILNVTNYPYGNSMTQAVMLLRLSDKNLRWESTKVLDAGFDMDIYKGLLGITFDWFKKKTYDILTTLPVPGSLGLSGPITNNGELENKGWEMELRHQNHIGELTYSVNFLISTFKNKVLSIATPTKGVNEVGLPYNSYYLYQMEGIFQSQADIDNSPKHIFYTPKPGDIKIKDQNGDRIINADDRISISPFPDFTYSFGFNVGWKGFNLSTFFQGVQGLRTLIYGWGIDPFAEGGFLPVKFRDAWSPTNPSNTIPALYKGEGWLGSGYQGVYGYTSTYHLRDASYLRLKSVNLSYDLPKKFVNKIKLQGLTINISGDNLFTFTKYEGLDPEMKPYGTGGWEASVYPQVRILSVGMKINF